MEGWRVDLKAEYEYLVWGRATVNSYTLISYPYIYDFYKENDDLNKGYGIYGSIKIVKETDFLNYFVEPFIQYWDIGKSKRTYTIGQDKNTTTEIGARLGVEF
jgi:hypothetical protein